MDMLGPNFWTGGYQRVHKTGLYVAPFVQLMVEAIKKNHCAYYRITAMSQITACSVLTVCYKVEKML